MEDKIRTLVFKILTKSHKKNVHHKLKDPPFFTKQNCLSF